VVQTADGAKQGCGDGSGPRLGVRLADRAAEWELLLNPMLTLGELYMDGRLTVTQGDLYDVLELGAKNLLELRGLPWVTAMEKIRIAFRELHQRNDRRRAKSNIAPLRSTLALYDLFDADRQTPAPISGSPISRWTTHGARERRHIVAAPPQDGARVSISAAGSAALYNGHLAARGAGVTLSEEHPPSPRIKRGRRIVDHLDFRLDYRRAGILRPNRVGRDVRACWHTRLRRIFPDGAPTAQR
jgi:cyclopropane-fatty-acyl-phospholipid synthase